MKKSVFSLAFSIIFLAPQLFAQNIWRCNNDPNVPTSTTLFRTLQEAHDAASNGDIIYVEPSYNAVPYGNLTCVKTLRIIGNGYWHDNNPSATQNWDHRASSVGAITIESGAGTILQGLVTDNITIKAANVTVTRCVGGQVYLYRLSASQDASGAVISHNFGCQVSVTGYYVFNSTTCTYTAYPIQNVVIKNNIHSGFSALYNTKLRDGGGCYVPFAEVNHGRNITLTNNNYVSYYYPGISNCDNCVVHSNIFGRTPTYGILNDCPGTTASFNVCASNPCGFGINNVDSANPSLIFNDPSAATSPIGNDGPYQLPSSSPAKGAGLGGVDAGAFGTNDPYRLSGLAPIPQITVYSKNASSGIYTTSTPMTITISVKGNN